MKLTLNQAPTNANIVKAYEPGRIIVGLHTYTESLILTPDTIIKDWAPQTPHEIQTQHLEIFHGMKPEILLLGTGETQVFPHHRLLADLMDRQIPVEVMDTATACGTYNILFSEDRAVAAALMMIAVPYTPASSLP